jgi:hypothetical protein
VLDRALRGSLRASGPQPWSIGLRAGVRSLGQDRAASFDLDQSPPYPARPQTSGWAAAIAGADQNTVTARPLTVPGEELLTTVA